MSKSSVWRICKEFVCSLSVGSAYGQGAGLPDREEHSRGTDLANDHVHSRNPSNTARL